MTIQINELHMEFLSVSEFLVEVADDLWVLFFPYLFFSQMLQLHIRVFSGPYITL